ncbi:unnamed protein product [Phaedon cochleariae]|uniref:SAP domain-containing protein n=1 Tax=Phaedon cochleariae TaxID=80249 RepID=A0A9N9SJA8_PHACE|nr:unnamed protein product [Phaedon cochleariae]
MLLLPVDVPGAHLKNNLLIEDHSVAELQRWLECRGYKKSGVKLELIERHVEKYGTGVVPPTSRPREWGIGSRKRNRGQTSKSTYPMKRLRPLKRAEFDPRPTNLIREVDFNSFSVDLQKGDELSMFQKILKLEYKDFQYSLKELHICSQQTQQFLDNIRKFLNNFSTELIEIPGTVQGSEDWYRWRTYFITSSNAEVVSRLISKNAKKNFLLRNLWRSLPPVMTAAMLYSKEE